MEMFDEELKGLLGDRYEEESPKEMPKMEYKPMVPGSEARTKGRENGREAPPVAEYVEIPAPERSFMERLTTCATWLGVCGGISMLMWWFEVNGLMAMEAAFPCILASTSIGSLGMGLNIRK